jgi:hypothetical protein
MFILIDEPVIDPVIEFTKCRGADGLGIQDLDVAIFGKGIEYGFEIRRYLNEKFIMAVVNFNMNNIPP